MTEKQPTERISKKSKKVFDFIISFFRKHSKPPTVREIAKNCGFSSPSTAHFHIKKLEKAGLISRTGKGSRSIKVEYFSTKPSIPVPLVGNIKAGYPATAEENIEEYYSLPQEFADDECFLLKIRGESMKDIGIMEGDLVLIKPSQTINPGKIGAFLVNNEATIKRFELRNGKPVLVPANKDYRPILPDSLYVLGKVVLLIRSY